MIPREIIPGSTEEPEHLAACSVQPPAPDSSAYMLAPQNHRPGLPIEKYGDLPDRRTSSAHTPEAPTYRTELQVHKPGDLPDRRIDSDCRLRMHRRYV